MFSLFCRPDERSGGRVGNKRKIRIRLDPAQYYADMRVRSPSCHSSMILMSCHHYFFLTTALKFLICTTTCLYIFFYNGRHFRVRSVAFQPLRYIDFPCFRSYPLSLPCPVPRPMNVFYYSDR